MPRFLYTIYLTTIVLLVIALLGGLTWANTLYARAHPGEKDFFVPWLAVRTFLTYGDNPYSSPVAQHYWWSTTGDWQRLKIHCA
jgi:hypothetical protein